MATLKLLKSAPKDFLPKLYYKNLISNDDFKNFERNFENYKSKLAQNTDKESKMVDSLLLPFFESLSFETDKQREQKGAHANSAIDLALLKDNRVNVIIEAKSPHNEAEFFNGESANCKALHEAILYYFRELVKEQNFNVKFIVITNFTQFYIFKARDFKQFFYADKKIKELFANYADKGNLQLTNTAELLSEFEKRLNDAEYFAHLKHRVQDLYAEQIECLYLDENTKPKDFYKALHREFLLDEFSPNDANSLNDNFYNELLYILGFDNQTSKKQLAAKHRFYAENFGLFSANSEDEKATLIISEASISGKNTILRQILNEFLSKHRAKFSDLQTLENAAMQLIIVWLNRILFLKLIEANLVRFNNNDANLKFLNTQKIKTFHELNDLFFETLAKPFTEREKNRARIEQFAYLPYLNSSIFEPSSVEREFGFEIDKLGDFALPYYKNTSLRDKNLARKKGEINLLEYLFSFLDAFDFGLDEDSEIHKELINSSVLGSVFENLNGYKDGSFFTPAEITMYMCKESVEKVVLAKFNEIFHWKCKDLGDLRERIDRDFDDKKHAFRAAFTSIKICDPAVGSGHFLTSALNEMARIYARIGLSSLPCALEIESDELVVRQNGARFVYQRGADDRAQQIQKGLFNLKKDIIENCLFGVDINPNSVEICKLRLWIELLKNSYYLRENDENFTPNLDSKIHQMQTLPNIDINIKCGNSLISRFQLHGELKSAPNIKQKVSEYKKLVRDYKDSSARDLQVLSKDKILSQIADIKETFKLTLKDPKAHGEIQKAIDLHIAEFGCAKLNDEILLGFIKQQHFADFEGNLSESQIEKAIESAGKIRILRDKLDAKLSGESYKNAFEWRFEFPEVLDENGDFLGFDLVIGNPPYGAKLSDTDKKTFKSTYKYAISGNLDTYKLFIERGFNLLRKGGDLGFIVPLSVTSSKSNIALHKMLLDNCERIKVSGYGDRPAKIFTHAEQKCAIIEFQRTNSKCTQLLTSKVNKRPSEQSIQSVMENLAFVNSLEFYQDGAFCKINSQIEISIMRKVYGQKISMKDLMHGAEKIFYRDTGNRYYNLFTSYATTGKTTEKSFSTENSKAMLALMSSSFFWWFLNAYSDDRHSYIYEFERFRLPDFSAQVWEKLAILGAEYESDIESKANFTSTGTKEYRLRKSKFLIDKIDDLICPLYGLSAAETDFIKNYEIEFRTDLKK